MVQEGNGSLEYAAGRGADGLVGGCRKGGRDVLSARWMMHSRPCSVRYNNNWKLTFMSPHESIVGFYSVFPGVEQLAVRQAKVEMETFRSRVKGKMF